MSACRAVDAGRRTICPGILVGLPGKSGGDPAPRNGALARRDFFDRLLDEGGQASVELVALAPVIVVVALAASQLLAAGAARELADHAAEAAAVALLQGSDPRQAAREAVPGWSRGRLDVRMKARQVRVRLRPRAFLPGLGGMLEATGEADAGPVSR